LSSLEQLIIRCLALKSVGSDVQFSYVVGKGGWELELRFGGSIKGKNIKGDLFSPVGEMNVIGTRITS